MNKPYTYYICWSKENFHYYGVRYAQGCCPEDLWAKYHTSSLKVKELRESLGEPDIIEVRKTFDTREQAIKWEYRVLKRLDVIRRDDWINEACWPSVDNRGRVRGPLSTEHKKTLSVALMGNTNAKGNMGKSFSNERKKKISKSMTGHLVSEETREKISKSKLGTTRPPRSEEWLKHQSISAKKAWQKRKLRLG